MSVLGPVSSTRAQSQLSKPPRPSMGDARRGRAARFPHAALAQQRARLVARRGGLAGVVVGGLRAGGRQGRRGEGRRGAGQERPRGKY
ncbi:hypothetical protein, partial [Streptomyces albus]|uniref:hypothetical protein n=1 Tax=Streptomyces albus TaxID=1888 RepID=UPI001A9BD923